MLWPLLQGKPAVACSITVDQQPNTSSTAASTTSRNKILQIIGCATQAPSSHNTQCWKFEYTVQEDDNQSTIRVLPDYTRQCPIVDPDNHHLFVSMGCAVENLVIAAHQYGYSTAIVVDDQTVQEDGVTIQLLSQHEDDKLISTDERSLFHAIAQRQVTRGEYDGESLSQYELEELTKAVDGLGGGVRVRIITDPATIQLVQDAIIQANTEQMSQPAFWEELVHWMRFNTSTAHRTGDGLHGPPTGNGNIPIPQWLGKYIVKVAFNTKQENEKIKQHIQSSAGIAVFYSDIIDHHRPTSRWIQVGRCYERFALTATAMGIRNAFLNQPVEDTRRRAQFARVIGLISAQHRPDLIIRFGRGPLMPYSFRRPVQDVATELPVLAKGEDN